MAAAVADFPKSPDEADTFPRLMLYHAHWRDKHPALREKDLGIWQTWTWGEVNGILGKDSCPDASCGYVKSCIKCKIEADTALHLPPEQAPCSPGGQGPKENLYVTILLRLMGKTE